VNVPTRKIKVKNAERDDSSLEKCQARVVLHYAMTFWSSEFALVRLMRRSSSRTR
jgi:hypothetical protein